MKNIEYIAETSSPTITTDPPPSPIPIDIGHRSFILWNLVLVFTRRPRTAVHDSSSLILTIMEHIMSTLLHYTKTFILGFFEGLLVLTLWLIKASMHLTKYLIWVLRLTNSKYRIIK